MCMYIYIYMYMYTYIYAGAHAERSMSATGRHPCSSLAARRACGHQARQGGHTCILIHIRITYLLHPTYYTIRGERQAGSRAGGQTSYGGRARARTFALGPRHYSHRAVECVSVNVRIAPRPCCAICWLLDYRHVRIWIIMYAPRSTLLLRRHAFGFYFAFCA